jgi:hypothetical protein
MVFSRGLENAAPLRGTANAKCTMQNEKYEKA